MILILDEYFKKYPFTGDALKIITHFPTYIKQYKFLLESQWWSKEKLEEYQLIKLQKLLNHAYENVPYYYHLFKKHGIKPRDISSLKDIQKIPYLTKEIIRKNINKLRAKNYSRYKFEYITTGGSTGYPLGLYFERGNAEAKYSAFIQRMLNQSSCHLSNKHAYLINEDEIYRHHIFGKILSLSSFHLDEKNLHLYVKKLRKHKPKFIVAFPSALFQVAQFIEKNNIDCFSSLKAIFCSGETIYDWQRNKIEKTFNCRVHAFYSHNEQTVFATTCNHSNNYHISPEFGITEVIDQDGKSVTKENDVGEIVGTGFINFIFPLIRYKTQDKGVITLKKCRCGRDYPILKEIEGRMFEVMITKTNRYIPLTGFYGLIAKCSKNVIDWQLIQEREGELIIKIIKGKYFSNKDEQMIKNSLKNKFSKEIDFEIQYTNHIKLAPSGKKSFLIQKLSYNND
ncbi:MAG: phenylacetate--CoA ligase family protein [Thermoplasmatales archaeon]|nr:MAG: phenylacetate--CoA ligase family protein [Thermoplasmatales archaeon]